jgi:FAD/FMN-containing dehydrogenase
MHHSRTTDAHLDQLAAAVGSLVWRPGDAGYDAAVSTWNVARRLTPAVAVEARDARGVAAAVRWAARHDLAIGAHNTGHGAVANAQGALVVSTRALDSVEVDPRSRIATVGAGARVGALTAAAAPHGLATVQGSTGSVGVGGFVSGGGLGVMSRTFGLAADHVVSMDVVTADGTLRTVDATHDADLFWALRGGKGNFGIITSLRMSLLPLRSFYGGGIFFDGAHASAVVHAYRTWTAGHSDRTSSSVALLRLPPDPALPDVIRGRFVVHVRMAHAGDSAEGAGLAADIRRAAPVLLDLMREMPAAALDAVHLDPPGPLPFFDRGGLLDRLPAEAVDALVSTVARPDSPLTLVDLRLMGGAIAAPTGAPSAVPGRDAAFNLFSLVPDVAPFADAAPGAVAGLFAALDPWLSGNALPNFLGRRSDPAAVRAAWPVAQRERLLALKRRWDPDNLFRLGHALVAPSGDLALGEGQGEAAS